MHTFTQILNYYLVLLFAAFYGSNGRPCVAASNDMLLYKVKILKNQLVTQVTL